MFPPLACPWSPASLRASQTAAPTTYNDTGSVNTKRMSNVIKTKTASSLAVSRRAPLKEPLVSFKTS